ncbi:hypothetical protein TNCT_457081 [Trichonephila clavata]|uniref:Uncharacterized protein n=1 Tax=Trichonephila clavata TaxID=2740835 RepID=A0A8X6KZM7_TRICU|nr:hypothetical protein TNCT_457081 [Trichonephila clavata]
MYFQSISSLLIGPGRVGNPAASESQKGFYGSLAPELPNGSNCPPVLVFLFSSVSMVTEETPSPAGPRKCNFQPSLQVSFSVTFTKSYCGTGFYLASLLPLSIEGVGQVKTPRCFWLGKEGWAVSSSFDRHRFLWAKLEFL